MVTSSASHAGSAPEGENSVSIHPLVQTLTTVRKARNMTQSELASSAGLSRMTVQRLESNGLDPRLSTLHEMAQVLEHRLVAVPAHLLPAFHTWLQQHSPTTAHKGSEQEPLTRPR